VRIEDAPLAEALSRLLHGADWGAEYVAARGGSHRLARVRVGPAPAEPPTEEESLLLGEFNQAMDQELHGGEEEPERGFAGPPSTRSATRRFEDGLASPDAERRTEAVEQLDYTSVQDYERLVRIAREDPDPAVRASAVETLQGDESYGAVKALVGALDDPDPDVVVSAIEALVALDDGTLAPELERLREHRDADVREAAVDALDALDE
jgi:HEAT repeat protein